MSRLRKFIREIHRRSLWQVLAIYVAGSWVALQVVDLLVDNFGLPDWFPAFALSLLVIGLPIVLATAFVQEGAATSAEAPPPAGSDAAVVDRPRPMGPSREGSRPWLHGLLTWRNALTGGVLAFALWGVAVAGWLLLSGDRGLQTSPSAVEVSPNRIAVFPFGVRSGEELAYLGEGLVNLLSTKLDGAGELRTVDPRALLSLLAREPASASRDPGTARSVAERVGAGLYVLGDVLELGGRLRLDAALYEVGGTSPVAEATIGGQPDSVFGMIDGLAVQLLGGRLESPAERMTRIAAVTTHSLPALKAYLEGERAFRTGHFEAALAALREAVSVDSAFALAYYRMSVTAQWLGRPHLERSAAEQALRRADGLSERDRLLLEAALAASRGEAEEAEHRYRRIVAAYPNDVEAWYQLGEVLFHHGPIRGRSITESQEAWEHVLAYEPDHRATLVHPQLIAAFEGRRAEFDSLTRRGLELDPGAVGVRVLRAYEGGDIAAQRRMERELADLTDNALRLHVYAVGGFTKNLGGAIRLAELLTASSRAPETRLSGHLTVANLELARGRWRTAGQALEDAATLDPTLALQYRVLLSLAPFLDPSEPELAALRDSIAGASSPRPAEVRSTTARPSSRAEPAAPDLVTALEPRRRSYLLGLVEAELGNHEAALRHAEELETTAAEAPAGAGSLVHDMALGVRAQATLEEGRFAEALGYLQDVQGEANATLHNNSAFFALARERFVRAKTLEHLGRDAEALRWFGTFAAHSPYSLPYLAPSHLRRAEILERRGDAEAALQHYRRFVEMWQNADPKLQPRVEAARARIDALAAEQG